MRSVLLPVVCVSGAILCYSPKAAAQYQYRYPLHVQFHLTAVVQEPFTGSSPQTFREKTVKIDNARLLELIGAATTNDFTGADLVVDYFFGGFSVVKGTNVIDVSSLFSRSGSGTFVVQGSQASDYNFDVRRKAVWVYSFMPGAEATNSFSFHAFERARIISSQMSTNTTPNYFQRAPSYGVGDGVWDGRPAVFTGTIDLVYPPPLKGVAGKQ
jgi:hypothetical protein